MASERMWTVCILQQLLVGVVARGLDQSIKTGVLRSRAGLMRFGGGGGMMVFVFALISSVVVRNTTGVKGTGPVRIHVFVY